MTMGQWANRRMGWLLLALIVGCDSDSRPMVTTKLVGGQTSLGWNGWSLYLVEVHQRKQSPILGLDGVWPRERIDTIPHIRTTGAVAVVGDTMVIGVAGGSATPWQYDVRTKELFRRPQPAWLNTSLPTPPPSFSTDGHFIAYLSQDQDATRLTVRSWPDGRVVAQSAPVQPRQLNPPRGGSIFWGNPVLLQASFPVSDSGPSIASLQGEVRGDRLEIVRWNIYPDYQDPQVRQLMEERAAQVNARARAAEAPQTATVADTSIRARSDTPRNDKWAVAARNIRRRAPREFRELPSAFAAQLEQAGCTIPESDWYRGEKNVIHGSFAAPGQLDWATLCMRGEESVIMVWWGGPARCPNELVPGKNIHFMEGYNDRIVFVRQISATDSYSMAQSDTSDQMTTVKLEHDGIIDNTDKIVTVWVCRGGHWVSIGLPNE